VPQHAAVAFFFAPRTEVVCADQLMTLQNGGKGRKEEIAPSSLFTELPIENLSFFGYFATEKKSI
jgi:hypothetical protein